MEERISCKSVELSDEFKANRNHVYNYSFDTFGYFQAEVYLKKNEKALSSVHISFYAYPECRHLATKSSMYRNIILDSHLIIYRITTQRIEVWALYILRQVSTKSVIFSKFIYKTISINIL